jgi:hypothetical protein
MPDQKLLSLAEAPRACLEQVLAHAETNKDAHAQRKMHRVAPYEKLSQQLELHRGLTGVDRGPQ